MQSKETSITKEKIEDIVADISFVQPRMRDEDQAYKKAIARLAISTWLKKYG